MFNGDNVFRIFHDTKVKRIIKQMSAKKKLSQHFAVQNLFTHH
jgi:hypothetical protein